MKASNALVKLVNKVVWIIGLITIMDYAHRRWPSPYMVVIGIFLVGCGVWYLWKGVVQPFKDGLREGRSGSRSSNHTLQPTAGADEASTRYEY